VSARDEGSPVALCVTALVLLLLGAWWMHERAQRIERRAFAAKCRALRGVPVEVDGWQHCIAATELTWPQ
jgi:hypothetical protein